MWKPFPALLSVLLASGCSGDDAADDDGTSGGTGASGGTSGGGPAGSSSGGSAGNSAGSTASGGAAGAAGSPAGGSSGSGKGGSAGAGTGGSSSGSVLRGAVSLNVLASSTCSLPAGFIDVPQVAAGHPVTATAKGDALEHGGVTAEGQRVTIACVWAEVGGSLLFDAAINIQVGAARATVNLGSMALVEGESAAGGLVALGPPLPQQYNAPIDSCTHTAIEIDPTTRSVWGEIQCPTFESADGEDVCEIGPSYYFFENCGAQ